MTAGKVYKAGIIGYGYMGEIRKGLIERNGRLKLAGICDTSQEVRDRIKDCPTFSAHKELLASDIDFVFVCTPNRHAPMICIDSMKAGKHVFCEKPPGRTVQDILDIRQAEKGRIKLMFGFNHRFHPGVMKAKVIIDSGRMGRIICMRGVYGKSGGVHFKKSWRNNRSMSGGGILLDQGIHMLDLFRYFCGDFDSVKCFMDNSFWGFDVEDNAYVMLQNGAGQTAFLHSSATMWKHTFRLNIILEQGYAEIEGLLSKTGSYGREKLIVGKRQFEDESSALGNPAEEITYFDRDISWDLEVDEFVKFMDEDRKVSVSSSQDALKAMEMVARAYKDAGMGVELGCPK